jgi:hypothetical protein
MYECGHFKYEDKLFSARSPMIEQRPTFTSTVFGMARYLSGYKKPHVQGRRTNSIEFVI